MTQENHFLVSISHHLEQLLSVRGGLPPIPQEMFENIKRSFWLAQLGKGVLLVSSGQMPGILLNILQCQVIDLQVSPPKQRIIWPKMSIILILRSPPRISKWWWKAKQEWSKEFQANWTCVSPLTGFTVFCSQSPIILPSKSDY